MVAQSEMESKPTRKLKLVLIASFVVFCLAVSLVVFVLRSSSLDDLAVKITDAYEAGDLPGRTFRRLQFIFWGQFDSDYWIIEDPNERAKLPLYKIIPAAKPDELTPANGFPEDNEYVDWHRSHGDASSSRYSLLDQINTLNVKNLEVTWIYESKDGVANVQCNPVVAADMLFIPTGGKYLTAINATSGEEIWKYESLYGYPAFRGLIWWKGTEKIAPRIYFPAGKRLVALDAKTGQLVKSFGDKGSIKSELSKIAPTIAQGKIIHATFKPYVRAYDVISGKLLWEFNLHKKAPNWQYNLRSGHPWGGMSMDKERGIAYITTGNPSGSYGAERPGRNLYTNSVIAIDIETGKELWFFQEVRHGLWDLDIAAPPILTTITRNGKKVDVTATVTKLGNTLLLDRLSGKPIFDFRLKRAPTSTIPGEKTWPYQPSLELPEPFARQEFNLDEITNIGEKNRESVLEQMEAAHFGFFEPPREGMDTILFGLHGGAEWTGAAIDPKKETLYVSSNDFIWSLSLINRSNESVLPKTPGREVYLDKCSVCHGYNREGASGPNLFWVGSRKTKEQIKVIVRKGWKTMSFVGDISDEKLDNVVDYVYEIDQQLKNRSKGIKKAKEFNFYLKNGLHKLVDYEGYPASKPPWGWLNAINLSTGKISWRVPLGEHEELTKRGLPITGTENFGGPIVTAGGLVFVAGTLDSKIRAFESSTGEELWAHKLPFAGSAPPTTYQIRGRQYIVIPATGGKGTKLGNAFVAFALPEKN